MLTYRCFFNTVYRITLKHLENIVSEVFKEIINVDPNMRDTKVNDDYETD